MDLVERLRYFPGRPEERTVTVGDEYPFRTVEKTYFRCTTTRGRYSVSVVVVVRVRLLMRYWNTMGCVIRWDK